MTDDAFDDPGEGIEIALPGDMIRKRHIATRASNRRRIAVLVEGDAEFVGYSIGLDEHSLQLLELPSGEVSSISLRHIVAISDDKPFTELSREDKDAVDRRTVSFRKTSQAWLESNWPNVYGDRGQHHRNPSSRDRQPTITSRRVPEDGDSQVWDRAG